MELNCGIAEKHGRVAPLPVVVSPLVACDPQGSLAWFFQRLMARNDLSVEDVRGSISMILL